MSDDHGERYGKYVVVVDRDGRRHALSAGAVPAICEEDGTLMLLLPGGRVLMVEDDLETMARRLSGERP